MTDKKEHLARVMTEEQVDRATAILETFLLTLP